MANYIRTERKSSSQEKIMEDLYGREVKNCEGIGARCGRRRPGVKSVNQ